MLDRIERQIERFAPGFRDCVLARSVTTPADIEAHNANLVGGDIAAGVIDLRPVLHPADVAHLLDAGEGPVHLFGVHASRRRRARHVRILCRASRAPRSVRRPRQRSCCSLARPGCFTL